MTRLRATPLCLSKRSSHLLSISFSVEEYAAFMELPPDEVHLYTPDGKRCLGVWSGRLLANKHAKSMYATHIDEKTGERTGSFPIYVIDLRADQMMRKHV
jgi:hypothetical protein